MLYVILMHISFFFFFANELLLAVHFILKLWKCYTKRKFEGFPWVQNVAKQRRQPAMSTAHLGQELLTNIQCSRGSRSFAKETLKTEISASHRKLTTTNWEPSLKLILVKLQKLPKNPRLTIYGRLAFEANWKGEKAQ